MMLLSRATTAILAITLSVSVAASRPAGVFWHSQPSKPNDTVIVSGGGWQPSDVLQVLIAQLPNSDPIKGDKSAPKLTMQANVLHQTNQTVMFVVPPNFTAGVYAYCVAISGTCTTDIKFVNAPDLWFVQGDSGEYATVPAGWIGAFGRSIAISSKDGFASACPYPPTLALVNHNDGTIVEQLSPRLHKKNSRWGVYFAIPRGTRLVADTTYDVKVHNGCGGPLAWTSYSTSLGSTVFTGVKVIQPPTPTPKFFNVLTAPGANDDQKVAYTLAKLSAANGGVMYFPQKDSNLYYTLTKTIQLPPGTFIKGDGQKATKLRFTSAPNSSFTAISGTDFSVEGISISHTNVYGFIAINRANSSAISHISNVEVRSPPLTPKTYVAAESGDSVAAIVINRAENTIIQGIQVIDHWGAVFIERGNFTRVSDVWLTFRAQSFHIDGGFNTIFEGIYRKFLGNGTFNFWPPGAGVQPGLLISDYSSNPYTRDYIYTDTRSESELSIFNDNTIGDGKRGAYFGGVQSVSGTLTTLSGPVNVTFGKGDPAGFMAFPHDPACGTAVSIVQGRGAGQQRFVTSLANKSPLVHLDREWDIVPDSTSIVALTSFRGRGLVTGNDFGSEGIHGLAWMAQGDIIYADNKIGARYAQPAGVPGFADSLQNSTWRPAEMWYTSDFRAKTHQLGWHYQFLNNTIVGNGVWLRLNNGGYPGYTGNMLYGFVARDNNNINNAIFNVTVSSHSGAILFENNINVGTVKYATLGSDVVLRNNIGGNGTALRVVTQVYSDHKFLKW